MQIFLKKKKIVLKKKNDVFQNNVSKNLREHITSRFHTYRNICTCLTCLTIILFFRFANFFHSTTSRNYLRFLTRRSARINAKKFLQEIAKSFAFLSALPRLIILLIPFISFLSAG